MNIMLVVLIGLSDVCILVSFTLDLLMQMEWSKLQNK